MSVDLHILKEELVEVFTRYGVVPQAYDYDLWTKDQQEERKLAYPDHPSWQESFEEVVEKSVDEMLGLG